MIKKKFLVTSVVILTVSITTVFAQVDAGQSFQQWYDSKFQQTTSDLSKNTIQPMSENMGKEVGNLGSSFADSAKQRIEQITQDSIWYSIGSIFIRDGKYIDQIRTKKDELMPKVSDDFDSFIEEKNKQIDFSIGGETEKLLNDFNDELDKQVQ